MNFVFVLVSIYNIMTSSKKKKTKIVDYVHVFRRTDVIFIAKFFFVDIKFFLKFISNNII